MKEIPGLFDYIKSYIKIRVEESYNTPQVKHKAGSNMESFIKITDTTRFWTQYMSYPSKLHKVGKEYIKKISECELIKDIYNEYTIENYRGKPIDIEGSKLNLFYCNIYLYLNNI
uniref:Uncharacterized protein n=1 Tax=viral metagenome TaxID=1070528 RepID=A0A6C0J9P7_9ZZZZ